MNSPPSCAPRTGSLRQQLHPTTPAARDQLAGAPASLDQAMAEEPEPSSTEEEDYSSTSASSCSSPSSTAAKKCVSWSTITVHEFGVGLGGSAVSNKGGPSIGLAQTPEFTWTTKVGEMAERVEGVHRFSPNQRIRLLQAAGIPDGIITRHARETNIILGSRRRSTTSWDDDEETEEEEEEEGKDKDSPRKRSADQAMLQRPCAVYLRRPRMIPVNYV
ncbi:hypothetical protein KRP22_009514 [Phytophthora ramorum]|uniref:uncharacterized protein n=1 Tax=Phytophthora ramorum TaxID=164328 RepID=UPI0030B638F4|nr:hypothetical protein KRP23_13692 [Phytophthora ramorum]KAH7481612.1 hypothetical protein KRP23_4790 [Phytophthora ramorum]KAH7502887.1 hypothetical protein KRP22_8347 [Phytophthora ramorum]